MPTSSPTLAHLATGQKAPPFDGAALLATLSPPFGECPNRIHATPMAAAILGSTPKTLEVERCRRRLKIATIHIGRRIGYLEKDLLAFIASCRKEG